MSIGISCPPQSPRALAAVAQRCDAAGVASFGVADSQAGGYRECYVTASLLLGCTSSIGVGPVVTNPLTRHPAVTASALSSLREHFGPRVFACFGTGDSAVSALGMRPATLATMREYIACLRDVWARGKATYQGAALDVARSGLDAVPVYLAGNGPRTLELAGAVADGVMVGSGVSPAVVDHALSAIERGARGAGRELADIDVWFVVRAACGPDGEEAQASLRATLAMAAGHIFRRREAWLDVPPGLREPLASLVESVDVRFKGVAGPNPNADLVERLGLSDFLLRRLAVAGTPSQVEARLEALRDQGVGNLYVRVRPEHVPSLLDAAAASGVLAA